jgi:hypothetical protein
MATLPGNWPESSNLGAYRQIKQREVGGRIVRDWANDPSEPQYEDARKKDARKVQLRRTRQRPEGRQDLGILVRDLRTRALSEAAGFDRLGLTRLEDPEADHPLP